MSACALLTLVMAQQSQLPPQTQVTPLSQPTVFRHGNQNALVYELQLTSFDSGATELEKLTIGSATASLATYTGDGLKALMSKSISTTTLPAGASVLLFLWVPVPANARIPADLSTQLTVKRGTGRSFDIKTPVLRVNAREAISLGAPFTGERWVAVNGPSNTSIHRRAALALNGQCRIGQRFAIDWVQMDTDGNTFKGDETKNESYLCYGKDVLATADGTVTIIVDGVPENVPNQPPIIPLDVRNMGGNQVGINLGAGRYAMYGHLIPGSIRVKVGDNVKRGQVLGKLGNSGNSSEPHLHFQVCDQPSFLESQGMPFRHERFWRHGSTGSPVAVSDETIIENEVVDFR